MSIARVLGRLRQNPWDLRDLQCPILAGDPKLVHSSSIDWFAVACHSSTGFLVPSFGPGGQCT